MQHEQRPSISQLLASETQQGQLDRWRLTCIRNIDLAGEWDYGEFRDVVHWVACHLQISWIDARRRVDASHAIEKLPAISTALESGELSLDKSVQLTRFATTETEAKLVKWAKTVSLRAVRDAADAAGRIDIEDVKNNDRLRNFGWRKIEDGTGYWFFGALPAEQGAVVVKAIDRLADRLKLPPHEEIAGFLPHDPAETLPQRRADALVLTASQQIAEDFDADRATVIVHAPLASLTGDQVLSELEDGSLLHAEVARRLSCDGRIQTVVEDESGEPIGIGKASRIVPPWLKRQVKYRDRSCTFPGCDDLLYNEAHHVRHWTLGGRTDLDNLILVCGFHHKAVHEYGWGVNRRPDGVIEWFRPSGRLHGVRFPRPPNDLARAPERIEQQELVSA